LFGVFNRIERWFAYYQLLGADVELGGEMLRLLLYAHDLALPASTKHQWKNMLRVLADFCGAYD